MHGLKKKEIEPRVRSTAKMLGIDELLKRKPGQLSRGQRQRVAMGRAIVREPDAFLMDEPLSNLDAKLRVEMRAYLATLHQRLQTTTHYVTHDQTEAMTMGDRVAVMRDGQLQQVDTPQRLYEHPVNLFVAGFIGSPAMNLVHSQLEERDGPALRPVRAGEPAEPGYHAGSPPVPPRLRGRPVIAGLRPKTSRTHRLTRPRNGSSLDVNLRLPSRWRGADLPTSRSARSPITGATARAASDLKTTRKMPTPLTLLAATRRARRLINGPPEPPQHGRRAASRSEFAVDRRADALLRSGDRASICERLTWLCHRFTL